MLNCFDTGHFEVKGAFVLWFSYKMSFVAQKALFFGGGRLDILAIFQLVLDRFDVPFMAFYMLYLSISGVPLTVCGNEQKHLNIRN